MISRDTYIQLTKFGIVGGLSFVVDLILYYLLSEWFGLPTYISKALSVISATLFNYYLNTKWTWGQTDKDKGRFARYMFLYILSGMLNVGSNEFFLYTIPESNINIFFENIELGNSTILTSFKFHKFAAVILATLVGMVVNFLGQKLWIFKED